MGNLVKATSGANTATLSGSGARPTRLQLIECQTKSYPASKGFIRAQQNAFARNTILAGSNTAVFPRTKSRLSQKHRVQEEHGFVPGKRGFVSQRRTFVFPQRNFVHRKRSLFATHAVLFIANKVSSAENKVVFKHPMFCLRRTGFCSP